LLTIQVYRVGCGLWRGPGIKAVEIYPGAGAPACRQAGQQKM